MANELRGTDSKDIGIRVEVGQLEAAIDLRLVAEYGSLNSTRNSISSSRGALVVRSGVPLGYSRNFRSMVEKSTINSHSYGNSSSLSEVQAMLDFSKSKMCMSLYLPCGINANPTTFEGICQQDCYRPTRLGTSSYLFKFEIGR